LKLLGENIHRPAHIHVKTWIPENPGNPTLVTQLYFEGDPYMDEFVKKQLILKPIIKMEQNMLILTFV
jgi:protocatechuate 3,4-dioxygenase beta subunit